jgi:hypothetical protein
VTAAAARDVAIEYGHSVLLRDGGYDDPDSLQTSARYAIDLRSALLGAGLTTTTQVLVDDKRVPRGKGLPEAVAKLVADCRATMDTDCFVLESSLHRLLDSFLSGIVVPAARPRLTRKLTGYYTRKGALACSHDIALWHTLRFGLLDAGALAADDDPVPAVDGVLLACRVAVSILPTRTEEYEDVADRDLLVWNTFIDVERQVLRFFFADTGGPVDLADPEWVAFKEQVLRSSA